MEDAAALRLRQGLLSLDVRAQYSEQRPIPAVEDAVIRKKIMDVATTALAERIARTLAGLDHSANASGGETSASLSVDEAWYTYLGQADAIIRAIREPSGAMSAAGEPRIWAAMVDAAITESEAL